MNITNRLHKTMFAGMAVLFVLAAPMQALAQGSGSGGAAPSPKTGPSAQAKPAPGMPVQHSDGSHPIGKIYNEKLWMFIAQDDLDGFRQDLVELVRDLDALAPAIQQHNIEVGFTEEKVNAVSDEELTLWYNSIPDIAGFRASIAFLTDRRLHPMGAANRAVRPEAAGGPAPEVSSLRLLGRPKPPAFQPLSLPEPISDPDYFGTCGSTRNDDATLYGLHITRNTLVVAADVADAACLVFVEILGEGTNAIACAAFGIAAVAAEAIDFAIDLKEFCDGTISDARLDASWKNSIAIHKNLDTHHMDIIAIETEFRTLQNRMSIEENLLLSGDLKLSMFQLPEGPHVGISINRTREIVLDTIQQNQLNGMPIGNAQTLFNSGDVLLAQNKYKDAYARYRDAYRAAVAQTIQH